MNRSPFATSTSSVMSSSGFARSMNACRLERNTRKKRSSRISTDAGCTQVRSNGSMPMRPAAMAARMSRSDRTTTAKYGLVAPREREHGATQLGPRAHHVLRAGKKLLRETPCHLQGARAGRASHFDVRRRVSNDDALRRRDRKALRREEHKIGRGLVSHDRIAAEVDLDLVFDAQPAKDPLAIRRTLPRDGGLKQAHRVERVERRARAAIEA